MHTLTRTQRFNRRKGLRGKNFGMSKKHRKPSPHIFATEKWVVLPPVQDGVKLNQQPMAFLNERKAMSVATAIAGKTMLSVEVDHQRLENGEWVSVE